VITNMVQLVKEGRFVVLRHVRRVAQLNLYRGLHQWNFDIERGEFVIWRPGREKVSMNRVLGAAAAIECFEEGAWVVCLLTKTGEELCHPPRFARQSPRADILVSGRDQRSP
jgi:hypothetical protein